MTIKVLIGVKFDENLSKLVMENMAFRKVEWSVWKLLDCRILHQIPKGFWEPWAAPKPPAVSNESPSENFCLRACYEYMVLVRQDFLKIFSLVKISQKILSHSWKKFQRQTIEYPHLTSFSQIVEHPLFCVYSYIQVLRWPFRPVGILFKSTSSSFVWVLHLITCFYHVAFFSFYINNIAYLYLQWISLNKNDYYAVVTKFSIRWIFRPPMLILDRLDQIVELLFIIKRVQK